jgi:hypothetical protein
METKEETEMITVNEQVQLPDGNDPFSGIPHPIPFDDFEDLPAFPVEAIPDPVCRDMVSELSHVTQVDPGFTACCLLGVLSTTAQGKFTINLVTHIEHPNLYVVGILDSGERKSPTISAMTKPLYDYQASKGSIIICNDVTTEKLAVMLAENNEKMSIISAEGGIFDIMAGRYSEGKGNFELYLQAYSHEAVGVYRIKRDDIRLNSPSLTMCLGVQSIVIEEIGKHKGFRGRGLLARFLYAYCKPQAGYRSRLSKPISPEIAERYHDRIFKLMDINFPDPIILTLEPEAQKLWNDFYLETEEKMRPGGKLFYLKDWGNKLPGTVARMAGLFHYSKYGSEAGNHPISVNIVRDSCMIGRYFIAHARAVLTVMNEPEEVKTTKKILEYIKRVKPETFKGRDVLRHTGFTSMDEIAPGLKLLCERDFIKIKIDQEYSGVGRPTGTTFKVNPRFLAM